MKKSMILALFFIVILSASTYTNAIATAYTYAYANQSKSNTLKNSSLKQTEDVTTQQLKAQISLFKEALDQLGAATPQQAATLWAKGFERRNGVMQYSVFCDSLKQQFIKERGDAENSYWYVGVSSPWLGKYELTNSKKISDASYEITVRLHWVAVGYAQTETKILSVARQEHRWCITNIRG